MHAEHSPDFNEGERPSELMHPYLSFEDFIGVLYEAVTAAGLRIDEERQDQEPTIGERRYECTVRVDAGDMPSRYHAHIHFSWDALMTFVTTYGPGRECELYHDDDELDDCPHQMISPELIVQLEVEFVLGDGEYQLSDISEVPSWVQTVQELFGTVFPNDDVPSVHLGMAVIGEATIIEKFAAEHAWFVNISNIAPLEDIAKLIHGALKIAPQLADRLPL